MAACGPRQDVRPPRHWPAGAITLGRLHRPHPPEPLEPTYYRTALVSASAPPLPRLPHRHHRSLFRIYGWYGACCKTGRAAARAASPAGTLWNCTFTASGRTGTAVSPRPAAGRPAQHTPREMTCASSASRTPPAGCPGAPASGPCQAKRFWNFCDKLAGRACRWTSATPGPSRPGSADSGPAPRPALRMGRRLRPARRGVPGA
jgi:hypothetical protein